MAEEKKIKKLSIRIEEDLHKALQHYAVDNEISIQELTIKLYKELLQCQ